MDLLELAARADAIGVKLEVMNGLPIWEAFPSWKHQEAIDRIRNTFKPTPQASGQASLETCACIHIPDVYIIFPDGSLKRPDVAIYCHMPSEEEKETALRTIPEAVIEVVSKGYEIKDLEMNPLFYLSHGVKDVVVFNPSTQGVSHFRRNKRNYYTSPFTIKLECGCTVTV
ncbi:MAG: Uma2 family endonuclease [Anaerolineae bacterium]|nr:Uma2 family endonuclease [Anaerolineae bacterium]